MDLALGVLLVLTIVVAGWWLYRVNAAANRPDR